MPADPGADLVAQVNHHTPADLEFLGVAEHGQSGGAAFARRSDGHEVVITRSPLPLTEARRTADVLSSLRTRGLPVPRHEQLVRLGDGGLAVVQERLPGQPARHTDASVIEAILALNERFSRLLADRPDVATPQMFLRESGPAFPRHETLEGYSDRSRRLLRRIRAIGADEPYEMTGDDLVHPDLTVPNVLFDQAGHITGVVDWNSGVLRGDRRWSLVKLRFDLTWAAAWPGGEQPDIQQEAIERVDKAIDSTIEPDLLLMYWAHWSLYQLHWAILGHGTEVIDLHLELGESRLM